MYDVSEFIEGIGSRRGALPARLLSLSRPSLPFREGVPGDRRDCPLFALGERTLECGLPDSLERALIWLIGGLLWYKQKTL